MAETNQRCAVVTGSNKGIGLAVVKQLASEGFIVVLTARDVNKGLLSLEKLKESSVPNVVFHQLDVMDAASVASLAGFIKTQFGKLDVLVNNAGVAGVALDEEALEASVAEGRPIDWNKITIESYELSQDCIETNYYGAKRTTEALLHLLNLSDSPRIVNVSSRRGLLKNTGNEWAKGVLGEAERLTEERVDQVLSEFRKDHKEGRLEAKGWPMVLSAYTASKAAMNAYTRILAMQCPPHFCINCVCPGSVKTDANRNSGVLTVEEGASCPVMLALLPNGSPTTGLFFINNQVSPF